ncbi:hypothetical protein ACSHT2_14580 [Bradyrhizobium sp. PUT101]|uniref:hypothetical protein n=1 Tax=Bradyrhizobium sp. PUT101 TaxID=3447427 RepID=UPI003F837A5F
MTIPQFRDRLETYRDITPAILRQHHLAELLARVAPVAEQFGVSLPFGAKPRLRLSVGCTPAVRAGRWRRRTSQLDRIFECCTAAKIDGSRA